MRKSITLAPGESKVMTFSFTPEEAKTYYVSVNGLVGSFLATEAPPIAEITLLEASIPPTLSAYGGDWLSCRVWINPWNGEDWTYPWKNLGYHIAFGISAEYCSGSAGALVGVWDSYKGIPLKSEPAEYALEMDTTMGRYCRAGIPATVSFSARRRWFSFEAGRWVPREKRLIRVEKVATVTLV